MKTYLETLCEEMEAAIPISPQAGLLATLKVLREVVSRLDAPQGVECRLPSAPPWPQD